MLPLGDPAWKTLKGGYRVPYDASVSLARLEAGEDVWDELWQELHHQGDLGEASYASVPHLVRIAAARQTRGWNVYALVATIEVERHRKTNPPVPEWMRADYDRALRDLATLGLADLDDREDALTIRSILGLVALTKGALELGTWISYADESEIREALEEHQGWSNHYRRDLT